MPWIITHDHLRGDGIPDRAGTHSPDWTSRMGADATAFRLYDDDGELYYEGLLSADAQSEEAVFNVLWFAMADSGCTEMRLLEDGEWRTC